MTRLLHGWNSYVKGRPSCHRPPRSPVPEAVIHYSAGVSPVPQSPASDDLPLHSRNRSDDRTDRIGTDQAIRRRYASRQGGSQALSNRRRAASNATLRNTCNDDGRKRIGLPRASGAMGSHVHDPYFLGNAENREAHCATSASGVWRSSILIRRWSADNGHVAYR